METARKIFVNFFNLFSFLIPKKKDKSGVCYNCGERIGNLGGHIDMCIDRGIWKIPYT